MQLLLCKTLLIIALQYIYIYIFLQRFINFVYLFSLLISVLPSICKKNVGQVMHYLHLSLLPLNCTMIIKFAKPCFRISWSRNFNWHFLMLSLSFLFLLSIKFHRYLHVLSMVFSAIVCRATFLSHQVCFSSSSRCLSIH